MKKKTFLLSSLVIFILAVAYVIKDVKPLPTLDPNQESVLEDSEPNRQGPRQTTNDNQPESKTLDPTRAERRPTLPYDQKVLESLDQFSELSEQHRRSLAQLTQVLKDYGAIESDRPGLLEKLETARLRPQNRKDENPYTGSLNIVRTQKPLPGTRYFHAQFFSNEDGSENLQHLSFEFRPGEQSFEAVLQALKTQLGLEQLQLTQQTERFRSWRTPEGYVLWVKVLEESDLVNDPFNAYTLDDVGVIRVGFERDPHDHAPAFHAEPGPLDEEEHSHQR